MELKQLYVYPVGAYLLAHDAISQRWAGAFCWSGDQIFRVMSKWSISIDKNMEIATKLNKPEYALLPKTHTRQPVYIEGTISVRLAQQFDRVNTLHKNGKDIQLTTLPSLPPSQIFACIVDKHINSQRAATLFYTDPDGTANLVIVNNQCDGLHVLLFDWMKDEQKDVCINHLKHLPLSRDDIFEVPVLIQGGIVQLLMESILILGVTDVSDERN